MTLQLLINLEKMVGSFLALSRLDLAPWQKVDLATLSTV